MGQGVDQRPARPRARRRKVLVAAVVLILLLCGLPLAALSLKGSTQQAEDSPPLPKDDWWKLAALAGAFTVAEIPATTEEGDPRLVISDSMGLKVPPELAHVVALFGQPTPLILEQLHIQLEARTFAEIVLWPGTSHFVRNVEEDIYLKDVLEMVEVCERHGAKVVVISPRVTEQGWPGAPEEFDGPVALTNARNAWDRLQPILASRGVPTLNAWNVALHPGAEFDGMHLDTPGCAIVVAQAIAQIPRSKIAARS